MELAIPNNAQDNPTNKGKKCLKYISVAFLLFPLPPHHLKTFIREISKQKKLERLG